VVASLERSPIGDAFRQAYVLGRARASIHILAARLATISARLCPPTAK
jgi:hypothetical protein